MGNRKHKVKFGYCIFVSALLVCPSPALPQEIAPATLSPLELTRRLHFRLLDRAPTRAELDQSIQESDWKKMVGRLLSHEDFRRTREEFWIRILAIEQKKDLIWIKEQVAANTPIDDRLRDWFSLQRTPSESAEEAAGYLEQIGPTLLGAGFECSRCHDHPFEETTSLQFLEMSGFLRKEGYMEVPSAYIYTNATPGEIIGARTSFGPEVEVNISNNDKEKIRAGKPLKGQGEPQKTFGNWISDFRKNPRPLYLLSAHYLNWIAGPENISTNINFDDDPMAPPPEQLAGLIQRLHQSNFDEVAVIREISQSVEMAARGYHKKCSATQWLRSIEAVLGTSINRESPPPGPNSPLVEKSQFLDGILKDHPFPEKENLDNIWLNTLTRLPSDTERNQITKVINKHQLPIAEIYRSLFLSDEFTSIP